MSSSEHNYCEKCSNEIDEDEEELCLRCDFLLCPNCRMYYGVQFGISWYICASNCDKGRNIKGCEE